MTVEEVAEFLRVHASTIYRLLKKHHIPAFKLGSDWRFNQESIERWVRERESYFGDDQALPPAPLKRVSSARVKRVKLRTA